MEVNIYQVDSFTSEVFKGNPAGVCITEQSLDKSTMLAISAEMAVSETAFLALDTMQLRWFTPEVEVSLCGHGTLAVAHILKELGRNRTGDIIEFNTLSGILQAELDSDCIHLLFPAPRLDMATRVDPELIQFLGMAADSVIDYGTFDTKQLIVLDSEDELKRLAPNFGGLAKLQGRGVLVTAKSDSAVDFVSRYFAPWVGVNEDPVTGSAHCALCLYWSEKLHKSRMQGFQASSRGGHVDVELLASGLIKLSGQAVTVLKGQMKIA
ncbi:PhzF family phenazine biosynthesis protein [Shewanella algidipiscicola]|uniref:Phenazine biosynthesis protein PhzF n=1 Tax=Shewanella algidipiscicola TaxID=614070 RepID=A0ABQ4P4W0_9GAMM|nr:PhzF family phenazine biosynthesis protein [Shewanella algidipiscicola]GIU42548.1 phenazine biosynthesis protein PhzF [Shewanella algidipiscicola]